MSAKLNPSTHRHVEVVQERTKSYTIDIEYPAALAAVDAELAAKFPGAHTEVCPDVGPGMYVVRRAAGIEYKSHLASALEDDAQTRVTKMMKLSHNVVVWPDRDTWLRMIEECPALETDACSIAIDLASNNKAKLGKAL